MHEDPALVHRAYLVSQTWLEMLRLKDDTKKTTFWALDADARTTFRAHGLQVIEHGGDLGVSMQYCKQHRNRYLQDRITKTIFLCLTSLGNCLLPSGISFLHSRLHCFPELCMQLRMSF